MDSATRLRADCQHVCGAETQMFSKFPWLVWMRQCPVSLKGFEMMSNYTVASEDSFTESSVSEKNPYGQAVHLFPNTFPAFPDRNPHLTQSVALLPRWLAHTTNVFQAGISCLFTTGPREGNFTWVRTAMWRFARRSRSVAACLNTSPDLEPNLNVRPPFLLSSLVLLTNREEGRLPSEQGRDE